MQSELFGFILTELRSSGSTEPSAQEAEDAVILRLASPHFLC